MPVKSSVFLNEYLKHALIIVSLFGAAFYFVYECTVCTIVPQFFLISAFIYTVLFAFGFLFRLGPLKYLGKLYMETENKNIKTKNHGSD